MTFKKSGERLRGASVIVGLMIVAHAIGKDVKIEDVTDSLASNLIDKVLSRRSLGTHCNWPALFFLCSKVSTVGSPYPAPRCMQPVIRSSLPPSRSLLIAHAHREGSFHATKFGGMAKDLAELRQLVAALMRAASLSTAQSLTGQIQEAALAAVQATKAEAALVAALKAAAGSAEGAVNAATAASAQVIAEAAATAAFKAELCRGASFEAALDAASASILKAPPEIFSPGTVVEYFSESLGNWMSGRVLKFNAVANLYDTEMKIGVDPSRIRKSQAEVAMAAAKDSKALAHAVASQAAKIQAAMTQVQAAASAVLKLPTEVLLPGTAVEYNSTSFGSWMPSSVIRFNHGTNLYDLSCKLNAEPSKIRRPANMSPNVIIPLGSVVAYYSSSNERWIPASVIRFDPKTNLYDLDVRKAADPSKIRTCQTFEGYVNESYVESTEETEAPPVLPSDSFISDGDRERAHAGAAAAEAAAAVKEAAGRIREFASAAKAEATAIVGRAEAAAVVASRRAVETKGAAALRWAVAGTVANNATPSVAA